MQNIIKYSKGKRTRFSETDADCNILHVDEKLQLAREELLRMEDEGGIALTKEQQSKINAYAKARKKIKALHFVSKHTMPYLKTSQE